MSRGWNDEAVPMDEDEIRGNVPPNFDDDVVPGPSRDDEEYPMTHKPRGKVVIFNHYKFNSNLKLSNRNGTDNDKLRLKQIFPRLEFQLNDVDDVCDDFTYEQIQAKLNQVAAEDHSKADCLVVIVMTHGTAVEVEQEKVTKLFALDQKYHESELWKPFLGNACPTLRGKPKLFFIQACRGTEKEKGSLISSSKAQRECMDSNNEQYSIPNHADILVARSATRGCRSYRHVNTGAVFIQRLCDELEIDIQRENSAKKELTKILLAVNRRVSQFSETITDDEDEGRRIEIKQMSWYETSLTRELYFRKLADETNQNILRQ